MFQGFRARLMLVGVVAATAVILAPVTFTAAFVFGWAWKRGWSPTRARYVTGAAWALPGAVWLCGQGPVELVQLAWQLGYREHRWLVASVPLLPWMLPVGITLGAVCWAARWAHARSGLHRSPRAAGIWAHRQWQNAMRRASQEARRPGLVPMIDRNADLVLGRAGALSESGAGTIVPRDPRLLRVPMDAAERHIVIIGEPGAGKTITELRAIRAWIEAAWLRHILDGAARPLVILADCKGGHDGARTSAEFAAICEATMLAGGRVGLWPGRVRLDLWSLPAPRLIEVLVEMVRSDNPYYSEMQDSIVAMAVNAPGGPPASSVDFVRRLERSWLLRAYPGGGTEHDLLTDKALGQVFYATAARYRGAFRRIGRTFDSGRHLNDFDALCCTIEGTTNERTAAAQAQVILELVKDQAARGGPNGERRQVLFVIDEFSAVADRINIAKFMDRSRSLGVSVWPVAQSWSGLGANDDQRRQLLSAAAGGILLMATPDPGKVIEFGGNATGVETTVRGNGDGEGWSDEGTGRAARHFLTDPDWIRQLKPGQLAYISHGQAVWGAVSPVQVSDRSLRGDSDWRLLPQLPAQPQRAQLEQRWWRFRRNPLPSVPKLFGRAGGDLMSAIAARRTAVLTAGDRIPVAELEAGLDVDAPNGGAVFELPDDEATGVGPWPA